MKKIELDVNGMSCGHCVKAIEGRVGALSGVKDVVVDIANGNVSVEFNSDVVSLHKIKETIENQGYYIG
ncbi:copper chaperone CopZ [Robertmurraya kyonggiensis]|uniref:Copper chaperone CopZ n=1 Tax=Robertmurraya kyonggiensis TaxID=1037680 RepID=A0A4U1D7D7_9BACI|nr:copper chaperone CopZ [Robertmurraya kyonggiensis]TKC18334.1 copper chaperone CopZ [Robertmurraya kyonggiensis]